LEYRSIGVVQACKKRLPGLPCTCIFSITPSLHFSKTFVGAVEKTASEELMENVQMQGFRNPEE
jgi:hypothetical protein